MPLPECLMCFLTVLEAERSDIQAVARLVSGEGSLARLLMSICLLPCLYTVFLSVCTFGFEFSFLTKALAILDQSLFY